MALEAGLALPVVALLLAALLAVTAVVADQLAVARAARAAARTMAVTGRHAPAVEAARMVVPSARVQVGVRGGVAAVTVVLDDSVLGVRYAVDARSTAPLEPAVR